MNAFQSFVFQTVLSAGGPFSKVPTRGIAASRKTSLSLRELSFSTPPLNLPDYLEHSRRRSRLGPADVAQ
jgi:hypothetical protein